LIRQYLTQLLARLDASVESDEWSFERDLVA
jgi:hypothetical protein